MTEPAFVYDDDCGFCTWWAELFAEHTHLRVVGFADLDADLRERLPTDYEDCSHLVTDDGVYSCGAAIEEALLRTDIGSVARPPVSLLRRFGAYRSLREWGYRVGADNRAFWGRFVSRTPPSRER